MFNNNSIHHEITKIKLGILLSNVYRVVPVLGKKSGHSQDGKALVCVTTRSLIHTVQLSPDAHTSVQVFTGDLVASVRGMHEVNAAVGRVLSGCTKVVAGSSLPAARGFWEQSC